MLARLGAGADVLVEGFRPGVLDRLGCGPARLLQRNPRLVVCSISGYGQDGPYAGRAGHDIGYIAIGGVLARNGLGEAPVVPGVQVGDFFGGTQQAVIAILAALLERERTGKGRHLDVAMSEGAMGLLLPHFGALAAGQAPQARGEDVLSGSHPCYRVYPCKGGDSVALGALEPKFWERFCAAVSRPEWVPRQLDRALSADLDELFLSATREEWVERLAGADCCFEPVLAPVEAREHPQHRHRGVFLDSAQMRTFPALCDPAPGRAPAAGEHTVEVLREHGLSEAEIEELRASGALG
jgi:crotonobetainyl-CoA:carnitine CoA-transferase CaiB-like acyl-CoA transferase